VNILDENLIVPEQDRLRAWRIPCQRIGGELGWKGMKDQNDVIPLLHSMRRPTFFTRDRDYYRHALLHSGYCLVYLDVDFDEVAKYARRFLRHKDFRTQAQRMGKVVRVHQRGVSYWQVSLKGERALEW